MKKWILNAVLSCVFLTGCGADDMSTSFVITQEDQADGDAAYVQLLEQTPVAEVEGEPLSPDGTYKVLTEGASEQYVSGIRPPETIGIVNTATNEIVWEDTGYLWQSALWSPDGSHLALAYAGRTWNQILIFETETWTSWQFTLPDGSAIPEYTFMPRENWGTWTDENTIRLTVGQGGDAGEQRTYRCTVLMEDRGLSGSVLEETTDVLDGNYDFDHDGDAETVEIVTLWSPELSGEAAWYELQVKRADGTMLWQQVAAESHVGWTSLFALELDGKDCLLRYNPYMSQGFAGYHYQLFSLDEAGKEVLLKENSVEFDINFGSPIHGVFDPAAIADFLWEAKGLLADSWLLLSTENGAFSSDLPGAEFENPYCYSDLLELDSRDAIRAALEREKEENTPAVQVLSGSYDFNRNGIMETLILEGNAGSIEGSSFWGLKVREGEETLWLDTASTSHAGWNSLFALKIDGRDYLLRYSPSMSTGCAYYMYQIFSLNEAGEEVLLKENSVEFDVNFRPTLRNNFDPITIAAFLEEVHEYLDDSTLLLSTEDGTFKTGGSGAAFEGDSFCGDQLYHGGGTIEENLRAYEAHVRAEQGTA